MALYRVISFIRNFAWTNLTLFEWSHRKTSFNQDVFYITIAKNLPKMQSSEGVRNLLQDKHLLDRPRPSSSFGLRSKPTRPSRPISGTVKCFHAGNRQEIFLVNSFVISSNMAMAFIILLTWEWYANQEYLQSCVFLSFFTSSLLLLLPQPLNYDPHLEKTINGCKHQTVIKRNRGTAHILIINPWLDWEAFSHRPFLG